METISIGLLIVFIGLNAYLWRRVMQIERNFGSFFKSADTKETIMARLNNYADQEADRSKRLSKLESHTEQLQKLAEHGHSRIGFVRFNPFADTGGDQSFCLAVLDYQGNGWVISSIHARTGSRVYAKQITLGQSSHNLSDEESTAVTKALKQDPYKEAHGK